MIHKCMRHTLRLGPASWASLQKGTYSDCLNHDWQAEKVSYWPDWIYLRNQRPGFLKSPSNVLHKKGCLYNKYSSTRPGHPG